MTAGERCCCGYDDTVALHTSAAVTNKPNNSYTNSCYTCDMPVVQPRSSRQHVVIFVKSSTVQAWLMQRKPAPGRVQRSSVKPQFMGQSAQ
jgi:hypothetical protein